MYHTWGGHLNANAVTQVTQFVACLVQCNCANNFSELSILHNVKIIPNTSNFHFGSLNLRKMYLNLMAQFWV